MRIIQFSKNFPFAVVGNSREWFVKDQANDKIMFRSQSYDDCYKVAEKLAKQKQAQEQTYEKLLADYNTIEADLKSLAFFRFFRKSILKQKQAAVLTAMNLLTCM